MSIIIYDKMLYNCNRIKLGEHHMTKLEEVIHSVLVVSKTPTELSKIYTLVKAASPELCDDTIPCSWCPYKHPKWQHQVSWDLQHLKRQGLVKSPGKGYWIASTAKG